jgi:hypothetical protein
VTVKEILAKENGKYIICYKQGAFWVCYEQSAYLVCLSRAYKPVKKLIKNCNQEVVTIGFPNRALEQWIDDNNIETTKKLCIKYYGRYVDDFYVFSNSKQELKQLQNYVSNYLKTHFKLDIHPNKIYLQQYAKGFLFLGAYIKPNRVYIGNRTKRKFKYVLSVLFKYLEESKTIMQMSAKKIVSILNSYLGLFSHYHTYKVRHKLIFSKKPCVLYKLGFFDEGIKKITLFQNLEVITNHYILKSCTN